MKIGQWFKSKKMKALVGGVVATVAATYGITMNGGSEEQMEGKRCRCIWYADVNVDGEGVNKK